MGLKFRNCYYFFIFDLAVFCMEKNLVKFHALTSVYVFSEVISVCVWNKILRSGFLGAIAEFAHVERHHKVEALASIILEADRKAMKSNIGHHCLIDVSSQHPSQDGLLRSNCRAPLSLRFVDNLRNDNKNREHEQGFHVFGDNRCITFPHV